MCLRSHNESRSAWTLISLAVRIGHALDLHRDPADLSFPPFEVEMRRRLWWQINVLDIRASEDRGSPPMIPEHSTRLPSNVNDEDLDPKSIQKVTEHAAATEMTFCLISHEVPDVVRRLNCYVGLNDAPPLNSKDREDMVKRLEHRLESRYLSHCDTTIPIFWVCSIVGRLIIRKGWLHLQYPSYPQPRAARSEVSRESILRIAVSILELTNMLEANEATTKWTWFFATYVQWHPLAVTLAELCAQTSGPLVERAWTVVNVAFDKWGDRVADTKKGTLWRPIKKLLAKAQAARLQASNGMEGQAVPEEEMQYWRTPDLGHTYTASSIVQSGVILDAVPAVPTSPSSRIEAASLFPQQQNGHDGYIPSDLISNLDLDQPIDPINWGEWDEFIESTWQAGEPAQENGNIQWTTPFGF